MYRPVVIVLIAFLSIPAFSVDSRVERWNLRIDRLKKIQNEALSGKADKIIVNEITGSEIKSSEEFLDILNRYKKGDGTLKSETRKYALTEIEAKMKETSLSVISLYYMSDIYKTAGDTQTIAKVSGEIQNYADKKFNSEIKISSADCNSMAEQYLIEKGMAEFDETVKSVTAELLTKVVYELSRSDYNSNETDFNRIIYKQIEDLLPGKDFFKNSAFNEKYLVNVPQWKFITDMYSNAEARDKAAMDFLYAGGGSFKDSDHARDIYAVEKIIFGKAREKISDMLQNTTPSNGAMGNNPYYEIPDVKKLGIAIDEIDRYRKALMQNINGSEDKDLVGRLKSNNTGIAARGINPIEAQFKSEEMRIERLKKIKGDILIYNEEVFKISRTHFLNVRDELYRYAALSADFLEVLYSTGKIDTGKYIDFHRYRSERYIAYISFAEKLTSNSLNISASGSAQLLSFYKGTIPKVLASVRGILKPESIPVEIRSVLKREDLKEYAAINADFRTKGTLLANSVRKNFDEAVAGFSRTAQMKKESALNSESQIGQDEIDRLYSFAKKCSDSISAMNYTEKVLNQYRDTYARISDELKKGVKTAEIDAFNGTDSLSSSVTGFNPEAIDKETATRELLGKEGMESLSGSIALVQYYRRKGIEIKFTPTNEEVISMKRVFSSYPEVDVSSWKMNGKNFRQIDQNVTVELKKLFNKNAWNNDRNNTQRQVLKIAEAGIKVSFNPPSGWKKLQGKESDHLFMISFQSPDMKGVIELASVAADGGDTLQTMAGIWPEKQGFSMVEKNWGKKDNSDFIKSTAKNRYDGVMESYFLVKNGYVIILSGKSTGDMYRQLNRALADIFNKLEVGESSI